jgi:hypothetical protein
VTSARSLIAVALLALPPAALPAPGTASRFSDDWAGALAAARARKVPLFVDAWAPW